MTRAALAGALALAIGVAAPARVHADSDKKAKPAKQDKGDKAKAKAKAKKDKKSDDDADDESASDDDSSDDSGDDDAGAGATKQKAKKSDDGDDGGGGGGAGSGGAGAGSGEDTPLVKQDLTGHDLGTQKHTTSFEKDRFFVDKTDTEKTEDATLIQGAVTSTSFAYHEGGGAYANTSINDGGSFDRLYTELRLQTDFRHIKGSRWEGRFDGRVRFVDTPDQEALSETPANPAVDVTGVHVQSGLTGENEYELRELWLIRNGERSDVTIGRQFITDLAAVKIDGVRVDYASSDKLTYLGFAGLYPFRGSRSLTTDYVDLKDATGKDEGKLVGAGGFGGAYRLPMAYGAIGAVVLAPLEGEQPRVFATSNGYWRFGPTLDLYHFAVIDFLGDNDALGSGKSGLTNLSGGLNYKPTQRLRMTASYNRVDTDTLNVQANAYLSQPQPGSTIQNEVFIKRLATNSLRGSLSAGLGNLERFEVTVAMAYRERPAFQLTSPDGLVTQAYDAASSVEVYGAITDRHSIAELRLGADGMQTYGVGSTAYQRSEVTALRAFAGRELASGHGEWEAEVSYATSKDANVGTMCTNFADCYGQATTDVLSLGGTLYYRVNRDWFVIGSAYLSRTTTTSDATMTADPTITGVTGLFRASYRF